nr:YciI family protein [Polymorphospora rubra]
MSAMPRYLLSVYGPAEHTEFGTYPSQEAMLQAFADTGAFNDRLRRDGHLVFADGLEPATTATTVDGQGAKPTFTDGPYLETKEHLGGFWVIEAADLDVALALAAEGSKACRGTVEVRPFRTEESVRTLLEP